MTQEQLLGHIEKFGRLDYLSDGSGYILRYRNNVGNGEMMDAYSDKVDSSGRRVPIVIPTNKMMDVPRPKKTTSQILEEQRKKQLELKPHGSM